MNGYLEGRVAKIQRFLAGRDGWLIRGMGGLHRDICGWERNGWLIRGMGG